LTNVNANSYGKITELYVKEGDVVKKGQVLFEIDPRTFQAALDQAPQEEGSADVEFGRAHQPLGQQLNIETKLGRSLVNLLLAGCQQIHKQSCNSVRLKRLRHVPVARAVAAASAAVREQNNSARVRWNPQIPFQCRSAEPHGNRGLVERCYRRAGRRHG
jgi:multidrug efflux pump subunit AcrA (membrane-fusion protein)